MRSLMIALLAWQTTWVCTARSLSGRPYRATGTDQELTMLEALKKCEAAQFRCVRGECVSTEGEATAANAFTVDSLQAN